MIFGFPMMLFGLLGVPVLLGIYWFRGRSRQVVVSSLLLWSSHRVSRQGGRTLERLQSPLVLLLELLALVLIVLAASNPGVMSNRDVRSLIIVLDDSYSMLAADAAGDDGAGGAGGESARDRAIAALVRELRGARYSGRVLLAGAEPTLLPDVVESQGDAERLLAGWKCGQQHADLDRAVAMALEIGSDQHQVVVVTDHATTNDLSGGQIEWWSFGRAMGNVAFTAAARQAAGDKQRVLLEVSNLSGEGRAVSVGFRFENGAAGAPEGLALNLGAGEVRQVVLELPMESAGLEARLPGDGLGADNQVTLLPVDWRPLTVRVAVDDGDLRESLRRGLEATGQVRLANVGGELVICDGPASNLAAGAWVVRVYRDEKAAAYAGPFMIDQRHPLCEGLSLRAAIWGAGATVTAGHPLIMAGNVVLMDEQRAAADGGRRLNMYFEPRASTVQETADWPILLSNLVRWRMSERAGVHPTNVRVGQRVLVQASGEAEGVEWRMPAGERRGLTVGKGRAVEIEAEAAGVHVVREGVREHRFAANVLSGDESDVRGSSSGRWGDWRTMPVRQAAVLRLGWIGWLAALVALAARQALLVRTGGRT